jgi:DNA-binding transcriptional regulator LsrR (DeoR family)
VFSRFCESVREYLKFQADLRAAGRTYPISRHAEIYKWIKCFLYSSAALAGTGSTIVKHTKMGPWSPKQEEKLDMVARVAWHYYVGGRTQNDIAEEIRMSRPTVQRLIAVALDRGIVTIRVHHKIGECVELARILSRRYNFTLCEVVPSSSDDYDQVLRMIAVAGAEVMESYLQQSEPRIFGLSIGRSVKSVIGELTAISRPQHRFVSLVGTIANDGSTNPYDVAALAAEKTGGKSYLLPAPLLANSAEEREQWCHNRLYRVVESLSSQADVSFVGIGEMGVGCPLQRDGFITKDEVIEGVKAGVVGEIMAWAFNEAGELVRSWIHERVTSIGLRQLPEKPVIAFAGGKRKVKAVLAALRGHWINGLVTDQTCAQRILATEDKVNVT